jgi:general secretion pathway protein B
MSYILDALKKSDQQRQRGAAPTLQAAQLTVAAPKRPLFISYGLLAAVVLVSGIMIGWLHPWQAERQPPVPALPGTEAVAAKPQIPISRQATLTTPGPLTAPTEMPGKGAQGMTAANRSRAAVATPAAMKPDQPAPVGSGTTGSGTSAVAAPMADDSARPAGAAQQQKAMRMDELPVQIQREIPAMAVQLHAYSNLPGERIVYINSTKLREGDSLVPGLMLEQITPDGMIFSYKGYRFQHGIR